MKLTEIYKKAIKKHFALGAFNFSNMETLQAISNASKKTNMPVIIAVSESAIKYMGKDMLISMVASAKKNNNKLFLHLDHGKSFDICKKCVDLGFDSIMYDGSSLPFEDNVSNTIKICKYAHKYNIQVEAELGVLSGIEDEVNNKSNIFTNPKQALDFVIKTGVDSLAIAIGTSHGAYKFKGEPKIDFSVLEEIESKLKNFPLVLHGASSVPTILLDKFNKYGGTLQSAKGVPEKILNDIAINHNIVKINTDTDLRIAVTAEIRKMLLTQQNLFDPRQYLGNARNEVELLVEQKINLFSKKI